MVRQKVVPTGPWFEAMRGGTFDVVSESACQSNINPLLDVQKFLPTNISPQNYNQYEDAAQNEMYEKMLHETDPVKQRALMRQFETYTLDTAAHALVLVWWNRIVPMQSYVKGWKISPSHFVNQDLGTVWLDQ